MEELRCGRYRRSRSNDRTHTTDYQSRMKSASDAPITFTHYMIQQEAVVAKKLSPDLNTVVQKFCLCKFVKVLNFIKSRALNTRLFANLCDEMESDDKAL